MDERFTWSLTWRITDKVLRNPGISGTSTSKRWAWRKLWETMIFCCFSKHDKVQDKFHNMFQNKQTLPSNSLKLREFETYCIRPNPPLFFRQQNMQWSCNMVHSHFTLCLRARDYIKQHFQHPSYGLWMRVKDPHHYKVMDSWLLAHVWSVKCPLVACKIDIGQCYSYDSSIMCTSIHIYIYIFNATKLFVELLRVFN